MPPQGRLPLALASEILSRPCGSRWTLARALSPQTTPSAIALSRRSLSSTPAHPAAPRPTGHTRLPIPKTRLPPSYLPPPSRVHVVPFEHDEVNRQLAFQSAYLDPEFGLSSFFHAARNAYRNRLGKTVIKRVELVRLDPTYVPFWVTKANISLTIDKPPPSTSPEDDIIKFETSKLLFPGSAIDFFFHLTSPTIALPTLPRKLRLFDPTVDQYHNDSYVQIVPFDLSPLVLPDILHRASSSQTQPLELGTHRIVPSGVDLTRFDCTPVYFPFWIAQYRVGEDECVMMLEDSHKDVSKCPIIFPTRATAENPRPTNSHYIKKSSKYMTASEISRADGMFPRLSLKPSVDHRFATAVLDLPRKFEEWMKQPELAKTLKKLTARRGADNLSQKSVGKMVAWEDLQEWR